MRRRVTVHTRHQLKQASEHHTQKRASLVAMEAIVVTIPSMIDVALYLLKRHSGIVWGPGRFAGLLRGGDVRRLGNPAGAPALGLTPWRTWGYPTNCKIPMSKV